MLNDPHAGGPGPRDVIRREIDSVLLNTGENGGYSLDDPLLTAGLNSLLLAQLLLQLETALGVDPFAADRSITDIRTIGELVAVYEEAVRAASVGM